MAAGAANERDIFTSYVSAWTERAAAAIRNVKTVFFIFAFSFCLQVKVFATRRFSRCTSNWDVAPNKNKARMHEPVIA